MTEIERILSQQIERMTQERAAEIAELRELLNAQAQQFQALQKHVETTLDKCTSFSANASESAKAAAQSASQATQKAREVQAIATEQITNLSERLKLYNERQKN
ncbi:hypothetical protein V6O07_23730, partial [Arthrospira platensis SPKY2]